MDDILIFSATTTAAGDFAAQYLERDGMPLAGSPVPEVTHLLLDVPTFGTGDLLRDGTDLKEILQMLPRSIGIIGGNMERPILKGYKTRDLLRSEAYLAENAAITADCAIKVAAPLMKITFYSATALVIGWGRIGKRLARLLRNMGCHVTVAARKPEDRVKLKALGYGAIDTVTLKDLSPYHLIYNTAPELILGQSEAEEWGTGVKIDLASRQGLIGSDVIWAKGLPGKLSPDSSGKLIAQTVLLYLKEEGS